MQISLSMAMNGTPECPASVVHAENTGTRSTHWADRGLVTVD